ncbi:MAG: response regulator transcription factor [Myxococcales bacterium]
MTTPARVLLVEDEANLRSSLSFILDREGFEVASAATGEEGLELARAEPPDLVVLDVNLPGIDGYETCERLRRDPRTAKALVMMVTARSGVDDIVHGFETRADDYVTKPFHPKVLLARIQALLRRRAEAAALVAPAAKIAFGPLAIDAGAREVRVEGKRVELTRTEFDLLHLLAAHPSHVFTRAAILEHVRADEPEPTERAVDFQVSCLRRKLGEAGKLVFTVRGVGYKLGEDAD